MLFKWWNTLHQGSSINTSGSSMAAVMLQAMLIMALGFWLYSAAVILTRVRREIEDRARATAWLNKFKD